MTEQERDWFNAGYTEHMMLTESRIRSILQMKTATEVRDQLYRMHTVMKYDLEEMAFESAKDIEPGLSRWDYEEGLHDTVAQIQKKYYTSDGVLKRFRVVE